MSSGRTMGFYYDHVELATKEAKMAIAQTFICPFNNIAYQHDYILYPYRYILYTESIAGMAKRTVHLTEITFIMIYLNPEI